MTAYHALACFLAGMAIAFAVMAYHAHVERKAKPRLPGPFTRWSDGA